VATPIEMQGMGGKKLAWKHSELLYDYIKFHLGLYIATPPVIAILAEAMDVKPTVSFQIGMTGMILAYLLAGAHASWFVAKHINRKWKTENDWISLANAAPTCWRRFVHHYLYWLGLAFGLAGMVCGHILQHCAG
jgi:hypothetical protein